MSNFCSLKKQLLCFGKKFQDLSNDFNLSIITAINSEFIRLRRFGIDSSGNAIQINKYGEPLVPTGSVYFEKIISGVITKQDNENDEKSTIGGKSSHDEFLQVTISLTEDVQENDLVEYPLDSNNWYKVDKLFYVNSGTQRYFKAYSEVRSTF